MPQQITETEMLDLDPAQGFLLLLLSPFPAGMYASIWLCKTSKTSLWMYAILMQATTSVQLFDNRSCTTAEQAQTHSTIAVLMQSCSAQSKLVQH